MTWRFIKRGEEDQVNDDVHRVHIKEMGEGERERKRHTGREKETQGEREKETGREGNR